MKIFLASAGLLLLTLLASPAFAQDASPSPSSDPAASATPLPTSTPGPSSTPSPEASASSQGNKEEVLGSATKLGETSRERQLAKWLLASTVGIAAFLIGIKILRANAEE